MVPLRPSRPEQLPLGWRHVDPPQRPVLFINTRSGGGRAARAGVAERARERGVEVLTLSAEQSLTELVRNAVSGGADALGMAGGDGSLATVAAAAHAHRLPFICIPAGTRNHFALDLGVDRSDLLGALDAFTDGIEATIDVAEVNGRIFLNNVSLGIYGDAVRRPAYRDEKLRVLLESANSVLGPSSPAPALNVVDDLGRAHTDPAVVLVSNNPYALDRPPVGGTRPTLAGARLGIVVLDRPGRTPHGPGRAWSARFLDVNAEETLHAGVDGEAMDLEPPLRFAARPSALRVRISSRHPGVSPSGRARALGAPARARGTAG
jgi:diacylglycerol kinase family enzyme